MKTPLSYFFSNSSLHGFKYLVTDDESRWKNVFARLFWTCFIAISICLMCMILSTDLNEFNTKATSINLDTNYLDWNNTFPAISICMTKGRSTEKIKTYMTDYWNETDQPIPTRAIRYYRAIQSLMFINYHQPLDGVNVENCLEFNETCGIDMDILHKDLFPQTCEDFMTYVAFLGQEVPCEDVFKLHQTEIGDCFTANSLYSNGKALSTFEQLPLRYSNRKLIGRTLEVRYTDIDFVIYKLYIHSPEELPDGNLEGYGLRKAQADTYIALKTIEIRNQNDVKDESISARQCRFPDEFLNEHKLPYSVSNCHFNERLQRELKDCRCTLPISNVPKTITRCNITKFECVKDSYTKLLPSKEAKELPCTVPSCLAMEIVNIGQFERDLEEPMGILVIDILNQPTLRYIRRVGITKLDMIGELFLIKISNLVIF